MAERHHHVKTTREASNARAINAISWSDGGAAVVEETAPFGGFIAKPKEHYLQIALKTGGGRHVCRWDDGPRFDGDYREGLLSLTPAGRTLEGECQAAGRRVLLLHLAPERLDEPSRPHPGREPLRPEIGPCDPLVWRLAQAIAGECDNGAQAGTLYLESAVTLLGLHLKRAQGGTPPAIVGPARGGLAPYALRAAKEYLAADLAEDRSLTTLAALTDLSPSHFCRTFTVSTGLTPHQWRTERRIALAQSMLRDRKASLAEVALACGFSSQSHFGAVFKRHMSVSPALWRRTQTD